MSKTKLTKREQGILEMHEGGYSRRDIAVSYGITRGLVDIIVMKAKRKLENCENIALTRANALLRKVLAHCNCACENDAECPCLIAANYMAAYDLEHGKDD